MAAIWRITAAALAFAGLPAVAQAQAAALCGAPADIADGWAVSAPHEQRLDAGVTCGIGSALQSLAGANPHGVVIARNGVLVYERYFDGPDRRWPQQHWEEPLADTPHDARTPHDLQSITKSVVSLLVGVARYRGAIKSLDVPVLTYFPEYADLRSDQRDWITLRDLMTMRAGLEWPARPYLSMARRVDASSEPYRVVLEQPMVAEPGRRWRYNNGAAELVGGVVQKATGRRLDEFAQDALFEPLGFADWEWGRMASGDPGASWGLRLRPRDLAKIGQLLLDHGAWHGRQVVSAEWISEMIAPRVVRPRFSYAYLWWRNATTDHGRRIEWISGYGWGGQCLNVIPDLALVVVVTAGVYHFDGAGGQNIACDAVMKALLDPAALAR